jgi:putative FmdB family regulatory protein
VPTYVYACKNCGHRFEKYQSFSEDSLTLCPQCHAEALRKVFDSVGIVFTSSKTAASGSTSAGDGGGDSAASTSESSTTSETPSPAPATAGAGAGGDASAAASA